MMFKFIHAADLHLDSPLRGLARYETAPAEAIRGATRRAFENLVDLALDEDVAFVLLAGDLFDGDWKDHQTGIYFNSLMGRLDRAGVKVYIVSGNHDAASRITKALKPPPNVTYLSVKKPQSIVVDGVNALLHGQGFEEQHTNENLAKQYPAATAGCFNIGLLHTALDGREGHAPYAPCSLGDLQQKGYQYWALGHVHQYEVVSEDPLVVFPGCIQGRHARETGPKGCMLVTVDDDAVVEYEHRTLDVVRWSRLSIDVDSVEAERDLHNRVREAVREELQNAGDRLLAVRVTIAGATSLNASLRADPDRWRAQVQAICAELGEEKVWVEKVGLKTRGKQSVDDVLADEGPLGQLLSVVMSHDDTCQSVPGLESVISDLKSKLPPALFSGEDGLDPASEAVVAQAIDEAKTLLVGRLLEMEVEA